MYLAEWTDLVVFDYITGHIDRYVLHRIIEREVVLPGDNDVTWPPIFTLGTSNIPELSDFSTASGCGPFPYPDPIRPSILLTASGCS